MPNVLNTQFDSVLMLTWSDWNTEPRSNRYHFASRFARHVPVFFLQPDTADVEKLTIESEKTELRNVTLWHTPTSLVNASATVQKEVLNQGLLAANARRPLVWIYNIYFEPVIDLLDGAFRVFHATEDYFSTDHFKHPELFRVQLKRLLSKVDLVVAVSDGVAESYRNRGKFKGPILTLPNGCDYKFFSESPTTYEKPGERPVAVFQGGINERVDFELLLQLSERMPDWHFKFSGPVDNSNLEWQRLLKQPNIEYAGYHDAAALRKLCYEAHVGIIPYRQIPSIVERSLPIKAFEYVACGLPVVSIPIRALEKFPIFSFGRDAAEFEAHLRESIATRFEPAAIAERQRIAAAMDYDVSFDRLVAFLGQSLEARGAQPKNILILYDDRSTHVAAIQEHLLSFRDYSRHKVFYAPATWNSVCAYDLDMFDVLIVHYSVRVDLQEHLSPSYEKALRCCRRQKLLFIQDEYDNTERARQRITDLGIDVVFTCVPEDQVEKVYPKARFPKVRFVTNLTGYVPKGLESTAVTLRASERPILIGYRGRALPYWYGDLGQEKLEIGRTMRRLSDERGLAVDIEWEDQHRIYGAAWYEFIKRCRAMLGTESGANVFDDHGKIRAAIEKALAENPTLSYQEAHRRFIGVEEGRVKMNQISPKIFEAIAFRTALILFEGSYSGVVRPNEHYIPLKKDFSNFNEVIEKLCDDNFVDSMTNRAYKDVIESGAYSYCNFVRLVEGVIEEWKDPGTPRRFLTGIVGSLSEAGYSSFRFTAPARLMPSSDIQQGLHPDSILVTDGAGSGQSLTESLPNLPHILRSLGAKMLLRYAAVNFFRSLPPAIQRPVEMILRFRK